MEVQEVTPNVDSGTLLAGAQFVDAYRVVADGAPLVQDRPAEKIFPRQPRWVEALLTLRNIIGTYQKRNARTWTSAIGREADERRAPPFRPQMGTV
jgi:hypothetical protein